MTSIRLPATDELQLNEVGQRMKRYESHPLIEERSQDRGRYTKHPRDQTTEGERGRVQSQDHHSPAGEKSEAGSQAGGASTYQFATSVTATQDGWIR